MIKETRVRWSPAEKALLLAAAKHAIAARPLRYMDALGEAQKKLPPARRRDVLGAWDVPWFVDGLGGVGASAHASASEHAAAARKRAGADIEGLTGGLRAQLVDFFTDVLAEALARAQRRVAGAKSPTRRAPGTVTRARRVGSTKRVKSPRLAKRAVKSKR